MFEKERKRGCTGFPEGNWHDCCVQHDLDYEAGGSLWTKVKVDHKLARCVASKSSLLMALGMFAAVMIIGLVPWYQHRYYQWKANK